MKSNIKYDLEERAAKFAEDVIDLVKTIKTTPVNRKIITQLVGSGGSIGVNYLQDKLISSLKEKHKTDGGLTEELYRNRKEYRDY